MKYRFLPVAAFLILPGVLHAQEYILPERANVEQFGCKGFGYGAVLSRVTHRVTAMVVAAVDTLSPSALAGVKTGDTVVAVNGRALGEAPMSAYFDTPPGSRLALKIRRDGKDLEIAFASGKLGPVNPDPAKGRTCRPVSSAER